MLTHEDLKEFPQAANTTASITPKPTQEDVHDFFFELVEAGRKHMLENMKDDAKAWTDAFIQTTNGMSEITPDFLEGWFQNIIDISNEYRNQDVDKDTEEPASWRDYFTDFEIEDMVIVNEYEDGSALLVAYGLNDEGIGTKYGLIRLYPDGSEGPTVWYN